jgi:hypothetical protein
MDKVRARRAHRTTSQGFAMSALGQKQTSSSEIAMSALPPIADIPERQLDVR